MFIKQVFFMLVAMSILACNSTESSGCLWDTSLSVSDSLCVPPNVPNPVSAVFTHQGVGTSEFKLPKVNQKSRSITVTFRTTSTGMFLSQPGSLNIQILSMGKAEIRIKDFLHVSDEKVDDGLTHTIRLVVDNGQLEIIVDAFSQGKWPYSNSIVGSGTIFLSGGKDVEARIGVIYRVGN